MKDDGAEVNSGIAEGVINDSLGHAMENSVIDDKSNITSGSIPSLPDSPTPVSANKNSSADPADTSLNSSIDKPRKNSPSDILTDTKPIDNGKTSVEMQGGWVAPKIPDKSNSKKKWIIISIIIAAIVAIIVTIVVVVMRNQSSNIPEEIIENKNTNGKISDESMRIYQAASSEIAKKIFEDDETDTDATGTGVINLYLKKINETNDTIAKTMLMLDYYRTIMVYQPNLELKDTVLGGLVKVDKILETANSALAVVEAASYYGDEKILNEYNQIVDERMAAGNYGFHGGDEEVGE